MFCHNSCSVPSLMATWGLNSGKCIYATWTLDRHRPQDVVDPDDIALVGGFVVDGDRGGGLDPQVPSSPLEPAIVTCHHLAFPQHWEETGHRGRVTGSAVHGDGSRGRLSQEPVRVERAPEQDVERDSQSSWLCRRFSRSSTWTKW